MFSTKSTRFSLPMAVLAVLLLCANGCSKKPTPPPAAYIGPTTSPRALGVTEVPEVSPCGYTLFQDEQSTGRFPCALAVARLIPAGDFYKPCNLGDDGDGKWWIDNLPDFEATRWNGLCDTIPQIREITVMSRRSVVSPDAPVSGILASAKRVNSGLCLVYGPASTAPDHAALHGVLLDTDSNAAIAFIRADAGPCDFEPKPPDRVKKDQRNEDVNYLVARQFEQHLRCCILELIERDQPRTTTQPSPWNREDAIPRPVYVLPNQPAGFGNY